MTKKCAPFVLLLLVCCNFEVNYFFLNEMSLKKLTENMHFSTKKKNSNLCRRKSKNFLKSFLTSSSIYFIIVAF